jgi:hypothetical protein
MELTPVTSVDIAVSLKQGPFDSRANITRPRLFCEEVFVGEGIHIPGVKVRTVGCHENGYIWLSIPTKYAAVWRIFGRNLNLKPLNTWDLAMGKHYSKRVVQAVAAFFPRLQYREAKVLRYGPRSGTISPIYTIEGHIEEICKSVIPWAIEKANESGWDAKRFCEGSGGPLLGLLNSYFSRYGPAMSRRSCRSWLKLHWFHPYITVQRVSGSGSSGGTVDSVQFSTPLALYRQLVAPYTVCRIPFSIWAPSLEYTPSLLAPPADADYICIGLSNIRPLGFEEYLSWSPRLYELLYVPEDDQDDIVIFHPSRAHQAAQDCDDDDDTCILRLAVRANPYYSALKCALSSEGTTTTTLSLAHMQYLATLEVIRLFPHIAGVTVNLRVNISSIGPGPRLWHDFRTPAKFRGVYGKTACGPTPNSRHLFIGVHHVVGELTPVNMGWDIKLFHFLYRQGHKREKGLDVFKPLHPSDMFILCIAHDHPSYASFVQYIEARHISGKYSEVVNHEEPLRMAGIKDLTEYRPFMKSFLDHRANSGVFPLRERSRMLSIIRRFSPGISCRVSRREASDVDMFSPTLYETFDRV